jgi:hypothetical protein
MPQISVTAEMLDRHHQRWAVDAREHLVVKVGTDGVSLSVLRPPFFCLGLNYHIKLTIPAGCAAQSQEE